jgi:threonine dehydratase
VIPDEARALVRRTPLVFAPSLGCWLKLESLQATGSFKLRGAATKLARLPRGSRIVAASAGNHGLGVALAARALGHTVTVVVPRSAARVKRAGIAALGAEVIVDGAEYDDAEAAAIEMVAERDAFFVSPYDDEDIIDGNGRWLAQEIAAERTFKRLLVPVGGGGLIGGLAQALPGVEVIGVQPRANCAMYESLAKHQAQTRYTGGATLCEGLAGAVSERTYELARAHVARILLVGEEAVLAAIAFAYRMGFVVEPSSAVAIAAARDGADADTCVVVTGSNIDPETLDRALGQG